MIWLWALCGLAAIYFSYKSNKNYKPSIIINDHDDEVVFEDMVLHDMTNQDDTYDIGVIDFND